MPDEALAVRRYLHLARVLLAEEGSQRAVARKLGVSQPSLHGWLSEPPRQRPKLDKIQRAIDRLHLAPGFFFSPELGSAPDYRDHIQRATAATNAVDNPAVDAHEQTEGPLDPIAREALAMIARRGAPIDRDVVRRAADLAVAVERARRELHEDRSNVRQKRR